MSAVLAQFRRRWRGTTLAVATLAALGSAGARWYLARGSVELPALPSAPGATVHGRMLFRPGERVWRPQARGPSSFTTAFERGLAAYNADDPEAAADAFEEAVRLAPHDPEAHINLGLVYLRLRRADDGLRELHEGARLGQQDTEPRADGSHEDATIRSGSRP